MRVLAGIWPNKSGSGQSGVQKEVDIPFETYSEGGEFYVAELGRSLIIESMPTELPEGIDLEVRLKAAPSEVARLPEHGWKSVGKVCEHCRHQ